MDTNNPFGVPFPDQARRLNDISDWMDKLEPNDTPMLNYLQKMSISYPNHAAAIIGHTKPAHPVLARMLRRPSYALYALSESVMRFAGYREVPAAEMCDACSCEAAASGRGLRGLALLLADKRTAWAKSSPIYDPEKVKEIDAAFEKAHPRRTMTWGMSEMQMKMAKDYEDSIIRPRKPDERDEQTQNPIMG